MDPVFLPVSHRHATSDSKLSKALRDFKKETYKIGIAESVIKPKMKPKCSMGNKNI